MHRTQNIPNGIDLVIIAECLTLLVALQNTTGRACENVGGGRAHA